ncbi:phage-like protein [Staphylococcus schleiferi]|nr:phage-like protein [Staphylococcus schleiferi]AKS69772.1 phage-like protein [Staphylococcus schleiferi]AKS74173.1 phage-like protein [Staphylococcus schleiferi]
MTQYLITTFTDSTGETFTEVTKARYNQTFTVVEAESKKEALEIYEEETK